jgi:tetratricopeptide (TPR) repeat protein
MKKLLLSLLALFVFANLLSAQEDPEKALSKAGRALGSYNLDPSSNGDKLKEATDMIEIATNADATNNKVKTWQTRGEVYNAVADKDIAALALNQDAKIENPDAPVKAAESFLKALTLAQKKFETKDALKGMKESASKLTMFGNNHIKNQDYTSAFNSLQKVLEIDTKLRENGEDPVIPDTDMNNHKYVLAFCAKAANQNERANQLFKELYEAKVDEPGVYAQYFNMLYAAKDPNAIKVLEEGRAKFPDDTEILFAEINYYIQSQQYEILEKKLQEAIAKEPNNPSIYTAMGNVYMNLSSQEFAKDRKSAQGQKYFDQSLNYFKQAVDLDPKQFDAVYSIGSLYFNKAVEMIKYAGTLGMTKAEQTEYDTVIKDANKLMETALPYFQKTEAIDANDTNTLIALSEIYARMNDFEKSNEFKKRLQTVKDGQKNPSSYFKM